MKKKRKTALRAVFEKLCDELDALQLQNEWETKGLRETVRRAREEAKKILKESSR